MKDIVTASHRLACVWYGRPEMLRPWPELSEQTTWPHLSKLKKVQKFSFWFCPSVSEEMWDIFSFCPSVSEWRNVTHHPSPIIEKMNEERTNENAVINYILGYTTHHLITSSLPLLSTSEDPIIVLVNPYSKRHAIYNHCSILHMEYAPLSTGECGCLCLSIYFDDSASIGLQDSKNNTENVSCNSIQRK
jgi:hypothetical protein